MPETNTNFSVQRVAIPIRVDDFRRVGIPGRLILNLNRECAKLNSFFTDKTLVSSGFFVLFKLYFSFLPQIVASVKELINPCVALLGRKEMPRRPVVDLRLVEP